MLADALGPEHLKLDGLTVPTLEEFIALSGGHCSILERPEEVNRRLRALLASATSQRRASS